MNEISSRMLPLKSILVMIHNPHKKILPACNTLQIRLYENSNHTLKSFFKAKPTMLIRRDEVWFHWELRGFCAHTELIGVMW